jgi:hypothetical protein
MAAPSVATSVLKLALAGEQAGFTVEQMIALLNEGVSVASLLTLIEWKLTHAPVSFGKPDHLSSSRWIM